MSDTPTATCSRCGESKPADTTHFARRTAKKNGLSSWCRSCKRSHDSITRSASYSDMISNEDLATLLTAVDECMICGAKSTLHVDHDEAKRVIRGLLCKHCNLGLGHFRDDPELLRAAADYLASGPLP